MRLFLSHSSTDRGLVQRVHDSLGADVAWLDIAEIEWGDLFLDRINNAVQKCTHFVLFWSRHSATSNWVRLELHMAFIRMMEENAIRLLVIRLDSAGLPLHLTPYQHLDVSNSSQPEARIIEAIKNITDIPQRVMRNRFLNRSDELSRMELALDDRDTNVIVFTGFAGIGKQSLAREGLRRFYQGAQAVFVDATEGTGITELALYLNALARKRSLDENLSVEELRNELQLSIESIARSNSFLLITNIQHWLDNDRRPIEPLATILKIIPSIPHFTRHPCLLTSTRRLSMSQRRQPNITEIWLDGLPNASIATLVMHWYELNTGNQLDQEHADLVAQQAYGHPIAAKLAAGLVAQYGATYLQEHPKEYVSLRRDLANALLLDFDLLDSTSVLMKALAAAGVPLPSAILESTVEGDNERFHAAISQATAAGLLVGSNGRLQIHPLISDHFWDLLHRQDYSEMISKLAREVYEYSESTGVGSAEFSLLIPVVFRLYAASGDWTAAQRIRQDLQGEIERAAIFHYRRRNYDLAWEYVRHALGGSNPSWNIRIYEARILIRKELWSDATRVLTLVLNRRPNDIAALHAFGWKLLRQRKHQDALHAFAKVLAQREHVASLRDSAECLHALDRDNEALRFLDRAKRVESQNPYVLDLESQIREARGEFDLAYRAAYVAMVRDPNNWVFHHRLGRINVQQKMYESAISHFQHAVDLDRNLFTPLHALAAALLDVGDLSQASDLMDRLMENAVTLTQRSLVVHLQARVLIERGEISDATEILEREVSRHRNLLPNLGLYADAKLRESRLIRNEFPATARVAVETAANAVRRGLQIDSDNPFLLELQERIEGLRSESD
ncbi:MAG: TIR domain-containing protein [Chloroflexi bacterium]|nr:TIR domain-containing protein [Chloroflexota bacterium]